MNKRVLLAFLWILLGASSLFSLDILVNGEYRRSYTDNELARLLYILPGADGQDGLLPLYPLLPLFRTETGFSAQSGFDSLSWEIDDKEDFRNNAFLVKVDEGWDLTYRNHIFRLPEKINVRGSELGGRKLALYAPPEYPNLRREAYFFAYLKDLELSFPKDPEEADMLALTLKETEKREGLYPAEELWEEAYWPGALLDYTGGERPAGLAWAVTAEAFISREDLIAFTLPSEYSFDDPVNYFSHMALGGVDEATGEALWVFRPDEAIVPYAAALSDPGALVRYLLSFQASDAPPFLDEEALKEALSWLKGKYEGGIILSSGTPLRALDRGEAALISVDTALLNQKEGEGLIAFPPPLNKKTGKLIPPLLSYRLLSVPRSSGNPYVAGALAEYLVSPEAQKGWDLSLGFYPVSEGIQKAYISEERRAFNTLLGGVVLKETEESAAWEEALNELLGMYFTGILDEDSLVEEARILADAILFPSPEFPEGTEPAPVRETLKQGDGSFRVETDSLD